MSKWIPDGRWAPWRRGALLFFYGVIVGATFTAPGRWAADRTLRPLVLRVDARAPLHLELATGPASRMREVLTLFRDMGDQTEQEHVVPAPDVVAERLARVDGWRTAVLFEFNASARDLHAAGLEDAEACVKLTGIPHPHLADLKVQSRNRPIRTWHLVLLDDAGRSVGSAAVTALRPGHERVEGTESEFAPRPGAPGDGELPLVSVFRRASDGAVSIG